VQGRRYFAVDKKKLLLDKLGNLLQFYEEIVILIQNQVCSAMFYTIFTQKKVYISNVIIFKNEKVFSKSFFLKQVKKYS
jgi:hypothetical protein